MLFFMLYMLGLRYSLYKFLKTLPLFTCDNVPRISIFNSNTIMRCILNSRRCKKNIEIKFLCSFNQAFLIWRINTRCLI